jgi:hypothetical protein
MLVMYLWVIGIDVGHVFLGYRYRCWLCISGLLVSILVMYFSVIGIDVGHVPITHKYMTNIDTYNTQIHEQHRYL